jgi:hypothetical protein
VYRFHRICGFFTIRFATISLTADSTKRLRSVVLPGSALRNRAWNRRSIPDSESCPKCIRASLPKEGIWSKHSACAHCPRCTKPMIPRSVRPFQRRSLDASRRARSGADEQIDSPLSRLELILQISQTEWPVACRIIRHTSELIGSIIFAMSGNCCRG